MKKLNLTRWLLTALAAMTVFSAPAAKKTFTAVTSNVDGLPPTVNINYGVGEANPTMNADGSQEPGATRMGQLIGESLWDIVALSEDFNYHNYIMDGVNTYYNASKHRGKIEQSNLDGSLVGYLSQSVRMNTDGLCMLTRKKYSVYPQPDQEGDGDKNKGSVNNWVLWNDHYGYTDNEADGLIRKGFRFYQVTLAEGLVVDVYITHMEAGSDPEDNAAREKQLKQFADYIKAHKGTNPIIILGDTNCRYTRDPLKAGFIDVIEQDPDLHVQDPWVQHMWDGVYPTPNSESLMVGTLGEQKGEVVDKIWYINNDKSKSTLTCTGYLHDDAFTYADGGQIADHYPVVGTFVIENPEAPEPSTGEVTIPDPDPKVPVVSGQTYFIRNVGSGEFIRAGGAWTTQAVMGDYPSKVTPTSKGGKGYSLKTTHDNKWISKDVNGGADYYMDQKENTWTLTQVKDNIYTMADDKGNAVGHNNGVLASVQADTSDPNQQWEFLTQADLLHELYYASSATPKDVTFMMKAPDFGYADQESWTNSKGNNASAGKQRPKYDGKEDVSFWKGYNAAASGLFGSSSGRYWNLSQTISGLPAGTYVITYQVASYNLGDNNGFTINNNPAPYTDLGESDPGNATVARNLASGQYSHSVTLQIGEEGKIDIKIAKEATKSASGAYYDNFNIKCIGVEGIKDMSVYDRVKIAIDDAQAKADEEGLKNYRNNQVVTLWAEQEIVGDGWAEVKKTYKNLAEAVLVNKEIGADYTYAIVNPSFELYPDYKDSRYTIDGAFPFGWSYGTNYAKDSGVWPASDDNKSTSNPDGEYIFNSFPDGNTVYQDVTLTPGIYKLTAKVASDAGNQVYLYAADKTASVTTSGANALVPITLNFAVSDGKPFQLGVAGSASKTGGVWFKADDFHLTRTGDAETIEGMVLLQLAINQVTERLNAKRWNDDYCKGELAKYQAMVDNYTLTGDGKKEFDEVFKLIRDKVYAQIPNSEIDYTYALANPDFEWGNTYGWDVLAQVNDTGARENSNDTYKFNDGKGYIYNTWDGDGYGSPISQTLTGLPAGHYVFKANFASHKDNYVYLEAIGSDPDHTQRYIYQCPSEKTTGALVALEFDVPEDCEAITLRAGSCNTDGSWNNNGGTWFKVDNFTLTRTGSAQICFFYKRLLNAMREAQSVADELPDFYSKQWDDSKYQDIIDKHLADGHDPEKGETSEMYDPLNGSSGINEINELFADLRNLIFSQTETGADMSGAISNNSFELGDLTGWTTVFEGGDSKVTQGTPETETYGTEGIDGTYLYNGYNNGKSTPISQVIPNMPSGRYTLKAKVASDAGNTFFLAANKKRSKVFRIPDAEGNTEAKTVFHEITLTFDVPVEDESKDVKIGLYPTTMSAETGLNPDNELGYYIATDDDIADNNAAGSWFKADDFRLTLDSRYLDVNWKPEFADCGTIMLPFALDETQYQEYLGKYGFKAYYINTLDKNETPSDIERNLYRIISLSDPLTELDANKPYLLKKDGKEKDQPLEAKGIKAETPETDNAPEDGIYHIFGWSVNTKDDNQAMGVNEILEGSLREYKPDHVHYHLQEDALGNVGFILHGSDEDDDPTVDHSLSLDGYHALISIELSAEGFEQFDHMVMKGFYFEEPKQEWKFELEGGRYGTLILPFEADLPAGLEAAEMTGVSEVRSDIDGTTYQVAEWGGRELTQLKANVPYVIRAKEGIEIKEFTFVGIANNTEIEVSPEGNLLTGLFKSRDGQFYTEEHKRDLLEAGHWVLVEDGDGMAKFLKTTEDTELGAYNAYIYNPEVIKTVTMKAAKANLLAEEPSANPSADVIYLKDEHAQQTYEWEMKGPGYDAIILPFEAEVPEGLEAYTLTNAGDQQIWPEASDTYQVLEKTKADKLEANKAYLLVKAASEDNSGIDTQAEDDNIYTFTGTPDADASHANGLLKGTFDDVTVNEDGAYLIGDEADKEFSRIEDGRGETVNALHAYIPAGNGFTAQYLVLKDPKDEQTGVTEIMEGEVNVDIYTLDGVMVRRDVNAAEALQELDRGIYILRSAKGTVKVIK